MARRFLNFVQTIRNSKKTSLRNLLKVIESDTRSVTGHNLRTLLLRSKAENIRDLKPHHVTAKYRNIPEGEEYRVNFVKEIIEVKNNNLEVNGFDADELQEILEHLCVSYSSHFLDSFPGVLLSCHSPTVELSKYLYLNHLYIVYSTINH